ncbi:hypothetical protein CSKR_101678 [Clonorchis sinensis]|uniref:Uncharacterized protein n=1 Tax=Clonorchis sinensis TaxID=79923 RepID=A0A419Q6U3_CLOSI|nr:hypothetical protein CSKR_101678 [Clonorchis sinensis]
MRYQRSSFFSTIPDISNKNNVGISGLTDTQFQPMGPTAMSSSVSSSSCPYAVCLNMHQLIWISVGLILLLFLVGLLMLVVYNRTRFLRPNKHCGSPLHLSTSTSNMYYPAKSVNPQIPRQKCLNSFSRPYQLSAALYQVTPAGCNEPVCYPKVEAPDYSFADENICSHHLYKHSDIESFYGSGLRKESCAGYLNLTVGRAGTNAADLYCHSSPPQADRRQPNAESCSASPLIAAGQVHEPIELQCGEIKHAPINTQSLGHRQDVRFCDGNFLKLSPRQFPPNSDHTEQDELVKRPTKQTSRTLEKMSPLSGFAPQCDLILLNNCTTSHFHEGHPQSINLPVSNSIEDKH